MQNSQQDPRIQQDDIDLFDLACILWKSRRLIAGGTLLTTVIAVLISLLLPEVYEVSTIIEPGKIKAGKDGEEVYFMSPEAIRESIISEAYDLKIKSNLNIAADDYPKFKVIIPKSTSFVKIAVETSNTQLSIDILNMLNTIIAKEINVRLELEKENIDNKIKAIYLNGKEIDELVSLSKTQIDETFKNIRKLETSKSKALMTGLEVEQNLLFYTNEIQNRQTYLFYLHEKLKGYEAELKKAELKADELRLELRRLQGINIVKPVKVSDKPVKPKKVLIVALTFFSSFLTMTMAALALYGMERKKSALVVQG